MTRRRSAKRPRQQQQGSDAAAATEHDKDEPSRKRLRMTGNGGQTQPRKGQSLRPAACEAAAALGNVATTKIGSTPSTSAAAAASATVDHPVLGQLFPSVQRLRDYVLAKLPRSSRIRRRKVAAVGVAQDKAIPVSAVEQDLAHLLDTTLVGHSGLAAGANEDVDAVNRGRRSDGDGRWAQWVDFSQRVDESTVTLSDGASGSIFSQSEVSNVFHGEEDLLLGKYDYNLRFVLTMSRLSISLSGRSLRRPRRPALGRSTCCATGTARTGDPVSSNRRQDGSERFPASSPLRRTHTCICSSSRHGLSCCSCWANLASG